jgi:hypothetical protein
MFFVNNKENRHMKLYHYVTKPNTVLNEGILSFTKNPDADLKYYFKRSNETTHDGIVKWMENCFEGRSRAIRGFSEPIQWTEKSINMFKPFIENADLFSIDLEALDKDGLIEAVYISPAIKPNMDKDFPQDVDERLVKLNSINDINTSPVDWTVCDEKLGLRFSVVPYYLIVIKGGVIPPKYITKEKQIITNKLSECKFRELIITLFLSTYIQL